MNVPSARGNIQQAELYIRYAVDASSRGDRESYLASAQSFLTTALTHLAPSAEEQPREVAASVEDAPQAYA